MSNSLRKIDIHIDKSGDYEDNSAILMKRHSLQFKDIKNLIKRKSTIVCVSNEGFDFIKEMYEYLNGESTIIYFDKNVENILKLRKFIDKPNVIFINNSFENNNLDNQSVDILIGCNLLGENCKSTVLLREFNRILKRDGKFLFLELISLNKPYQGFINYFSKKNEHVFNKIIFNFKKKLKYLRECEYRMKIIGNGNFYFNSYDVKSLQEFCDLLGYRSSDRINILSEILLVSIQGNKKKY